MNRFKVIIILLVFSLHVVGQEEKCDKNYMKLFHYKAEKKDIETFEKSLIEILWDCPDHISTHKTFQDISEHFCISVPIMSLMWRNLADPYSDEAVNNIKRIKELSERYIVIGPEDTTIVIPEQYAINWDAKFENNINSLEMGFTLIGWLNYDSTHNNENFADKLMKGFERIFYTADSTRNNYFGFYYEFFYDYFWSIYKSKHFKTAAYLIMLSSRDSEIEKWITRNSDKVSDFYDWRNKYLDNLKESKATVPNSGE